MIQNIITCVWTYSLNQTSGKKSYFCVPLVYYFPRILLQKLFTVKNMKKAETEMMASAGKSMYWCVYQAVFGGRL